MQGIVLSIGNTYYNFGSIGNNYGTSNSRVLTGYTHGGDVPDGSASGSSTSTSLTGSAGSTQVYTMTHNITKGGKNYVFTVTYTYGGSGTEVDVSYNIQAPADNTDQIKMAHAWDTYLTPADAGPGKYVGPRGAPGETVSVSRGCDSYQGFQYVSGTQWSGHYSAYYGNFQDQLDNDLTFDNTVNTDPATDNGLGISIDFGTPTGSVSSTNKMIFAPDQSAPTLSSQTLQNDCSSATPDEITEGQAKALVSSGTALVKFFSGTPATASNEITFPITAATTIYAANSVNGCYYDTSLPITVTFVTCCEAGNAAPALSTTSITTNCSTGNTANLTSVTASNQPAPATVELTWHSATPATDANRIADVTALGAGTYYAAFRDNTNNCYNEGGTTPLTVTTANCAAGTVDCDKIMVVKMPIAGTASNHVVRIPVNITTAGQVEVEISGSGMTLIGSSPYKYTTTTTGEQFIDVPVKYDGTALGTATVNVHTLTGSPCTIDFTDNTAVKDAVIQVWSKECLPTCGPSLK